MTTVQERLRHHAATLRTNSMPLKDLIPLLQQAADELDRAQRGEPVGRVRVHKTGGNAGIAWSVAPVNDFDALPMLNDGELLYTAQQPSQERKPMTEAEITKVVREASRGSATRRDGTTSVRIVRAVEAFHDIKEKPCIDNHAEIERLRSESEERLQNCVALGAENEQLRKDAERYRWLRDKTPWTAVSAFDTTRIAFRFAGKVPEGSEEAGADLDAAIDAARSAQPVYGMAQVTTLP